MKKQEHILGNNKIFVQQLSPDKKFFTSPLIFVHGSFGGYWMWEMMAPYLASRGFECFLLSLRGHNPSGKVDLGSVRMQDYVEDVSLVIKELQLESPVLIGHSMGGLIVLMNAAENSVKALVSIDPSPSVEISGGKTIEEASKIPDVYDSMEVGMPGDMVGMMEAMPDVSRDMLMQMQSMLGPESGSARRDRKIGISIPKEKLDMPILMFAAQLGDSLPFGISAESTKKMAEYYNADFFEIKGASHPGMLAGEHAQEVVMKIESWLKEL